MRFSIFRCEKIEYFRKACEYNPIEGLTWTWVSTYHLMHIRTGLCLAGPFQQPQPQLSAVSPGVRVLPCNLSDIYQQWVCHSRNPFHLKLRAFKYSLLYDRVDRWDRAWVSGPLYSEECESLWRSISNEYLCDERYRPAENLVLLKKFGIKPPHPRDVACTYPDRATPLRFNGIKEAYQACTVQGGRPATVAQLREAMLYGFAEGCACAYVADDTFLRGVLLHDDESCQGVPGLPSDPRGVFQCDAPNSDYVWCFRGEMADDHKFFNVQYAPLCAVLSFLRVDISGLEARSCLEPRYFACRRKITDVCSAPPAAANAHYTREDWRNDGDGAELRCDNGYGRGAVATDIKLEISCSSGSWNPNPSVINCQPLACPDPPADPSATLTSDPGGITSGNYRFSHKVTYRCNARYGIKGSNNVLEFVSTCDADQTWFPDPNQYKCQMLSCGAPPHIYNAISEYNASTGMLKYRCKEGYWISRGVFESATATCNSSGYWNPDPNSGLISCEITKCEDPLPPANGKAFITSYRFEAVLTITCDLGYSRVPNDLKITCGEDGQWTKPPDGNWCQNVSCGPPGPTGANVVPLDDVTNPDGGNFSYNHEIKYTCTQTGHGLREPFLLFSRPRSSCLGQDGSGVLSLKADCSTEDQLVNWMWVAPNMIMSLASQRCLTATGSAATRGIALDTCDSMSPIQQWDCPIISSFTFTLALRGTTFVFRIKSGSDDLEVTNAEPTTLATWKVNGEAGDEPVCAKRASVPTLTSTCTQSGLWLPPQNVINCSRVQCPPLPEIEGATKVLYGDSEVYGINASYSCPEGQWVARGHVELSLLCNEHGAWVPEIEIARCSPLVCPPPYQVQYAAYTGFIWNYQANITYTCVKGYWFSRGVFSKIAKCNALAMWEPDPETSFECLAVTCLDPGPRPNAKYYIADTEVAYDALVQYECEEGYWLGSTGLAGKVTGISCSETGDFVPHQSTVNCQRALCNPPPSVRNARFKVRGGLAQPIYSGTFLTIECIRGYWIREGLFSTDLMCNDYGQWIPQSRTVVCSAVICPEPYFIANAILRGTGLQGLSTRTVTCHLGFFIEQLLNLRLQEITCDPRNATWIPRNVRCKEAVCEAPGLVINAGIYINPSSYTYKETFVYRCDKGFQLPGGGLEFGTTCRANGHFSPDITGTTCNLITCNFTAPGFDHGSLSFADSSTNSTLYDYGSVVTLTCDEGYWVVENRKRTAIDFTCEADGFFAPNPVYVACTVVECAPPPRRTHATVKTGLRSAGTMVRYECSQGYGTPNESPPRTTWDVRCMNDSTWSPNPNIVNCKLVNCGLPPIIKFAAISGTDYTYGRNVNYKCLRGKWFGNYVFEKNISCTANKTWNETLPDCQDVHCVDPVLLTDNAEFVGTEFDYLNLVTIRCYEGYFIGPGTSHATVRCLETGQWDLPRVNFTCKAVFCPFPPHVWHAVMKADNYSLGAVVTYECEDGYLISRSTNKTNITCTSMSRWHPEPYFIRCLPKTSFLCDPPEPVDNANILAYSFAYDAVANVTCVSGYWFDPMVYTTLIQCGFDGNWQPTPRYLFCERVRCRSLKKKLHSRYGGSSRLYNSVRHLICDDQYRIETNFSGELTKMTYMRSLAHVCGADGAWNPSPYDVSCAKAGCPPLTLPDNMTSSDSLTDTSFGREISLACVTGYYLSPGLTTTSVYCLDTGQWSPDLDKILCMPVTCGIVASPLFGIFSGTSSAYGESVIFRCHDGYHMPLFDNERETVERIPQVTLKCGAEGFYEDINNVIDCSPSACDDPGYISFSSRNPREHHDSYPDGSRITFTCRNDTWFFRDHRSETITCVSGDWRFHDQIELPPCKRVTCWHPPSLAYTTKPEMWTVKEIYEVDEEVVYQCNVSYQFNLKPPEGQRYHRSLCQNNGKWSPLPTGLACDPVECPQPPLLDHSSHVRTPTLYPGDNVTYTCDEHYRVISGPQVAVQINHVTFTAQCTSSGDWFPNPFNYRCSVARCPNAPVRIAYSTGYGTVFESGHHKNYVCEHGYTVGGTSSFFGRKFVNIVCRSDGRWSLDPKDLFCQEAVCGRPPPVGNATSTYEGIVYRSGATYHCTSGHFIDQYANPPVATVDVSCGPDGTWQPDPLEIYCDPFDCMTPPEVENAAVVYFQTTLHSKATYKCLLGHVMDHGEDGLQDNSLLLREAESQCLHPNSWVPSASEIRCVSMQCIEPEHPERAYIKGGRYRDDGTRHFRYGDLAHVVCAHGYYLEGTDRLTSKAARCGLNGTWSEDLSLYTCVDLTCPDPGQKDYALRDNGVLRYLSRLTYTCNRGYFVSVGLTRITLECSYNATWIPATDFECIKVSCGDPGHVANAVRKELNTGNNFSIDSRIEYTCLEGNFIAEQQDAVGQWIVGESQMTSTVIVCQASGRWKPRRRNVRCTSQAEATTLYELIPNGELLHPDSGSKLIPERALLEQTGRSQFDSTSAELVPSGRSQFKIESEELSPSSRNQLESGSAALDDESPLQNVNEEFGHVDLLVHCDDNKVFVVHHLGRWIDLNEATVETKHIPNLLTDTGVECRVASMFDDEIDTYWMPVEAPLPDSPYHEWPGWTVTLDLQFEHVVGSFMLLTSMNYVNDVKTFYILVSSNSYNWKQLGPFNTIIENGRKRKEFFYEFNSVQTRFVRLHIASTMLMAAPIVTSFGVYGARFECVERIHYATDSYLVPVFVSIVVLVLVALLISAARKDKINRYKRFILKAPPRFDEDAPEPSRMYELSLTTAYNSAKADVLVKVVGTEASSPILWVRSTFRGALRPYYTDTHVIQVPTYLGTPVRVDVMCAYTEKDSSDDVSSKDSTSKLSECCNEQSEKSAFTKTTSQSQSSLLTLFTNESSLIRTVSKVSQALFVSRSSNLMRYELYDFRLRDPGTGEKWKADIPYEDPVSVGNLLRDTFHRKKGVIVNHGEPRTFPLIALPDKSRIGKITIYNLPLKIFAVIAFIYREHLLLCRNFVPVRNLTCFEKRFITTLAIIHSMFFGAVLQGFSDHTFYFVSRLDKNSNVFAKLFQSSSTYPHSWVLLLASLLLIGLPLLMGWVAGKWTRTVEDSLSYWQGVELVETTLFVIRRAFSDFVYFIQLKRHPLESKHVRDSPRRTSEVSSSSDEDYSDLDLSYDLQTTLHSTYSNIRHSADKKVILNPKKHSVFISDHVTPIPPGCSSQMNTDIDHEISVSLSSGVQEKSRSIQSQISQGEFLEGPYLTQDSTSEFREAFSIFTRDPSTKPKNLQKSATEKEILPTSKKGKVKFKAEQKRDRQIAEASGSACKDTVLPRLFSRSGRLVSETDCSQLTVPCTSTVVKSDRVNSEKRVGDLPDTNSCHSSLFNKGKIAQGRKSLSRKKTRNITLMDPNSRRFNGDEGGPTESANEIIGSVANPLCKNGSQLSHAAPTPSGRDDLRCQFRCSKAEALAQRKAALCIKDPVLHVITYRAYAPRRLGKHHLRRKSSIHRHRHSEVGSEQHRTQYSFKGIMLRSTICFLSLLYMFAAVLVLLIKGAFALDGAGSKLVDIFIFDIAIILFVLMPMTGWRVLLLDSIKSKTLKLKAILARNAL